MAVKLIFRCGCEELLPDSKSGGEPPRCLAHHAGIARVVSRPPLIVGTAHGPHVKTQPMDPAYPTLRSEGHGPLALKEPETTHHG